MALDFNKKLPKALTDIIFINEHHLFSIHEKKEPAKLSSELINKYGEAKWNIIEIINQKYSTILKFPFNLYNWLHHNKSDELAYFLNEAGSNTLNHSQFKAPYQFHLWLGQKGFVVGIEQKGFGFNAQEINKKKIKENEGAAFNFFRNCQSTIFFDNNEEAKIVFFEHIFL